MAAWNAFVFINSICRHARLRQGVIKRTCKALAGCGEDPTTSSHPCTHTHTRRWLGHRTVVRRNHSVRPALLVANMVPTSRLSLCPRLCPRLCPWQQRSRWLPVIPHLPAPGSSAGRTTGAFVCKKLWEVISDREKSALNWQISASHEGYNSFFSSSSRTAKQTCYWQLISSETEAICTVTSECCLTRIYHLVRAPYSSAFPNACKTCRA